MIYTPVTYPEQFISAPYTPQPLHRAACKAKQKVVIHHPAYYLTVPDALDRAQEGDIRVGQNVYRSVYILNTIITSSKAC
eukprot:4640842-Pleurochrysis_carterae.AAC.1